MTLTLWLLVGLKIDDLGCSTFYNGIRKHHLHPSAGLRIGLSFKLNQNNTRQGNGKGNKRKDGYNSTLRISTRFLFVDINFLNQIISTFRKLIYYISCAECMAVTVIGHFKKPTPMNFQLNKNLGNWLTQLNGKTVDRIFQVDYNGLDRHEDSYLPWLFVITNTKKLNL